MEHRWGQRTAVDLVVSLRGFSGTSGMGRLRDVSATGAFLQTNLELPLLAPMRIDLLEGIPPACHCCEGRAYVVRKAAAGFGIEWFAPAPESPRSPRRSPGPIGRAQRGGSNYLPMT